MVRDLQGEGKSFIEEPLEIAEYTLEQYPVNSRIRLAR
jgi:hypothetical protein